MQVIPCVFTVVHVIVIQSVFPVAPGVLLQQLSGAMPIPARVSCGITGCCLLLRVPPPPPC